MISLNKPPLDKCDLCLFKQMVRQFVSEEDFQLLYHSTIQLKYFLILFFYRKGLLSLITKMNLVKILFSPSLIPLS